MNTVPLILLLIWHIVYALEEASEEEEEGKELLGELEENLGSVVDEHGCRPSAGYSWCESSEECLRAYEVCAEVEVETTIEIDGNQIATSILDDILSHILRPEEHIPAEVLEGTETSENEEVAGTWFGGDEDYMTHGDSGTEDDNVSLGGVLDADGCLPSAGYSWCEKQNTCVRPWLLEGEWDDECMVENSVSGDVSSSDDVPSFSTSSDSSGDGPSTSSSSDISSDKSEDGSAAYFYNEDGTVKEWVYQCLVGTMIACTIILVCLVMAKRKRFRHRGRRSANVQMIPDYARFGAEQDQFVFQETIAVKKTPKENVPRSSDFTNLV